MRFYERVISDFGGYEKCKDILSQPNVDFIMNAQGLREHMLEYRRQHNIFEVGDEVVHPKFSNMNIYEICEIKGDLFTVFYDRKSHSFKSDVRHATDAEIKVGRRL